MKLVFRGRHTLAKLSIAVIGLGQIGVHPLAAQHPPTLRLQPGTVTPVQLDPSSRAAAIGFALSVRTLVRLELSYPDVWKEPASLCGIEGLEYTKEPDRGCAEYVEVVVETESKRIEPEFEYFDSVAEVSSVRLTLEPGEYQLRVSVRQNKRPTDPLPDVLILQPPVARHALTCTLVKAPHQFDRRALRIPSPV